MIETPTKKEENNLPFAEISNNGKSKTVPVDSGEQQAESVKINFQEEDLATEYASKPTKTSNDNGIDPNKSVDEVQKEVLDYETSKSGKMEYKDLLKTAEFLINLLDNTMSMAFKYFAKDTAAQAYGMPAPNKKLLTEQLALVLAKYQSKFKIEFIFFSSLIVMYVPMAIEATKIRKQNTIANKKTAKDIAREEKKPIEKTPHDIGYKHDETKLVELPKKEDEPIPEIKVPFKRKPGKQKKLAY